MARFIAGLASLYIAANAAALADDDDIWRSQISLDHANLQTFEMILFHNGAEAGSMTYGWEKMGDGYFVRDRTVMDPNILETAASYMDSSTLLPQSVNIDFSAGKSRMTANMEWRQGWRTGQMLTLKNGSSTRRHINLEEDSPAPLRLAVFGLVPSLPLRHGYSLEMPWFNTLANRAETVTISVRGEDAVIAPAGNFECWVIDVKGGSPENILYITKTLPRQIARIDVVGQPMHFLLAK